MLKIRLTPRATNEQMLINMDPGSKKPVAFLPAVLANIDAIEHEQSGLPRPTNAGRVIRLPHKQAPANRGK